MAKDSTPLEEFRRVTATTMRAVSRKEVNVSFVPDGGSLLGSEARITVPARDLPVMALLGLCDPPEGDWDHFRAIQYTGLARYAILRVVTNLVLGLMVCQVGAAATLSAQRVARRVAGAAMAEAFDQIGAAIPLRGMGGIGTKMPAVGEHPFPYSDVATDVTEDVIRDVALPLGFVDVKVCAVDETWSGLKLLRRRAARK